MAVTNISALRKNLFSSINNVIEYNDSITVSTKKGNVVIISEEIGKEGFLKIADFLMRYPETRKQFFLMQAKDCKAKDILKMVSPLESFPSQHIASLLKSNRHTESVTDIVDYASFISLNSKPGIDPILPTITIIGDKKKGQKEAVLESTAQKAYVKLDSAAIYKNGKFLDYLSFKDNLMVTMINNKINEMNTVFKYKNGKIGFNSDNIKTKTTVTDNIVQISVSGEGSLFEVNSKAKIDNKKVLNDVENVLNKTIEKRIKKVVNDMQVKYQADVFGFGNKIYQNNPKLWKQIDKNWDNYYFPNLKIKANSNIKITSTGSLNKTILEEKHETDN